MRIRVAHDYLTQRGGAERVALTIASGLSSTPIITSVYDPATTFEEFREVGVQDTLLSRIGFFRSDPRRALPLLAILWSRMTPVAAEAVVCSSAGWAHALPVRPGTAKIVYCHNPARWLYQAEDYLEGHGALARVVLGLIAAPLRRWDRRQASRADAYVVNSTSVAQRVREAYGLEPQILFPPVSIDITGPITPVDGLEPGYFLTVSRDRGYKGTSRLIDAFSELPEERLVVVGTVEQPLPPNVRAVGRVSDATLRWLYANGRALISVSHEDFGLTPLEANAFGTPVLVLRAGGFLDSTAEGVSGLFIENQDTASIKSAVQEFPVHWDASAVRRHADRFSVENFLRRLQEIIEETIDLKKESSARLV
ncbi:glycosyltransferase [Curtobacterium sp. MCBD17_028]|uniref:glycosyltransferase n=1 Tax=Curtobacterium sp. MCBD17_028 TaxID=2175670 RepID=UPI000DA93C90|nr:glycosyltransferase [Curtobacterium sp. MCBD17_028]PZE27895.1 glycosyltransferase family 4 protein [Curtobacterium sp. MCBD17_028]